MGHDAYWLTSGPGGGELGGCCLMMTLRDYARLGLFALSDGQLEDGSSILPKGWMRASTEPSASDPGYGYLWWLDEGGSYSARGIFGQMIFIDPESQTVVALHGNTPTAVDSEHHKHRDALVLAIRDHLRSL